MRISFPSSYLHLFAFLSAQLLSMAHAAAPESPIASRTATVEGAQMHYLRTGHGPTVILLHGYTQTSRMWRPILRLLAAPAGRISFPSSRQPRILRSSLRPSCPCRCWPSAARRPADPS